VKLRAPRWFLWTAGTLAVLFTVLGTAGWLAARHFQPFVRQQVVLYLEDKFGTGVELGTFHVSVTLGLPWKLETAVLRVTGDRLVLPYPDTANLPPLVKVGKFRLESGLGVLWKTPRRIREVRIEQVEINIPPPERRPAPSAGSGSQQVQSSLVEVQTIHAIATQLNIFPADPTKPPRAFEIHDLQCKSAGGGQPMRYRAKLDNPTPPGEIQTTGTFGPWQRDDPGTTPITGEYEFKYADLGVFHRIAGTLSSTGKYKGALRRLEVDGETRTPNFRLTGGNTVPLDTRFHSIVDGTTGDTYLQPVDATLGRSRLVARGSVTRPKGAKRRIVDLDVVMTNGHIEDLLRLAVKGVQPLMSGDVNLNSKLRILPLPGNFNERMVLGGTVDMEKAHFTAANVQEKIDSLSRRAQGQPTNENISDVLSSIRTAFNMRDGDIAFSALTFQTPGANIHLKGSYGIYSEQVDLHGVARLQAKVSQTMTGWKRLVLKPIDPFLSKSGAGTLLPIKITGTRQKPEFGLDRGGKGKTGSADRRN
jgi:AsmA-like C-terminal region